MTRIDFELSHGQLAVFASSLKDPYNDWTKQHHSQGFTWRPGSVSFRSMVGAGYHWVEVEVVNHAGPVQPDAVRVIEVPFEVPVDGAIEVGSIAETFPLSLPAGSFLLRCEFMPPSGTDEDERVRLTFAKEDTPRFAVVRADPELSVGDELLTTARPAI
ncbi:competence protein ComJ [Bradyrhizobium ivorense]|uniref:competence protein ComJ n=1 Tax=Bradyrhizobium ivorense TaxID=2511166 RepID=UPI00155AFB11|nr:competence protein ComJ [Bradyrhizobium ivorense]